MSVAASAPPLDPRPLVSGPSGTRSRPGERLTREDGLLLFQTDDLHGLGRMADIAKSRPARRPGLLRDEPLRQPDQRLRAVVQLLRLRAEEGRGGSVREHDRGRARDDQAGHARGPHHGRPSPGLALRVLRADDRARSTPPGRRPRSRPSPPPRSTTSGGASRSSRARRSAGSRRPASAPCRAAAPRSSPSASASCCSSRGKADAARWCEIHGIAHSLGIRTNATMLYGHVETLEERVDHLLRLREQQDKSGGFLTFIPLSYQVGTTKLVPRQTPPTDDLRTIAVSRLLLDNFPHIEAYWVMLGEATASAGAPLRRLRRQRHARGGEDRPHGQGREPGRPRAGIRSCASSGTRARSRWSATLSTTWSPSGVDMLEPDPGQGRRQASGSTGPRGAGS